MDVTRETLVQGERVGSPCCRHVARRLATYKTNPSPKGFELKSMAVMTNAPTGGYRTESCERGYGLLRDQVFFDLDIAV
jgi:hypothetical protein